MKHAMGATGKEAVLAAAHQAELPTNGEPTAEVIGCHRQMAGESGGLRLRTLQVLVLSKVFFGHRNAIYPVQPVKETVQPQASDTTPSARTGNGKEKVMIQQIDDLKAVLQNRRSELARAIRVQSSQLNISDCEHELIDRIQCMSSREETVTLLDTLSRTLAAVDAALLSMKEGSYGICAECDEPIARKRLKAIPRASHCIRCQETMDRRNNPYRRVPHWDEAA